MFTDTKKVSLKCDISFSMLLLNFSSCILINVELDVSKLKVRLYPGKPVFT